MAAPGYSGDDSLIAWIYIACYICVVDSARRDTHLNCHFPFIHIGGYGKVGKPTLNMY